jgi:DNA-binding response OmpR family regulator
VATVFLVSGEQHLLQVLEAKFVQEGFGVATCSEADAVGRALELRPDLVILEQRLVDGLGRPLYERFKAEPSLQAIPIILLTVRDAGTAAVAGAAAVAMPFRPKQLIDLARKAL